MKEPALDNKMAKFGGFEFVNNYRWLYPDGTYHKQALDFSYSLDACFKWLVPKLRYISLHYDSKRKYLVSVDGGEDAGVEVAEAETPALALCLAISKLIEKDIDKQD